jgi:pimeloyl-ACP methyl ester carboxylesterase
MRLPGWGLICARLENKHILRGVLGGGLHDPKQLPDDDLDEHRRVGRRSGYPTATRAIYRNLASMITARARYAGVSVPVTLVYGDEDWSRPSDRQANVEAIPGVRHVALPEVGHFAALEASQGVARILLENAA